MKKRFCFATIGCVMIGSMMLSACASGVEQVNVPEVIQVQTVENNNKVSLTSSETVKVVPDMAQIAVTIRSEDIDATVCQQENTEDLNKLMEYLSGLGFEEKSIETSGFSLNPRYNWSNNEQKLVGYEMRTSVTITDIPLEQVGEMLTGVVENGANEIDSVSYFSSEYDAAYNQALAKAIELSRSKGEALAAASGMKLGAVLNIQEYSDNQYGRYVAADAVASKNVLMEAAAVEGAAMDVSPGEMEITAEISVEFALVAE